MNEVWNRPCNPSMVPIAGYIWSIQQYTCFTTRCLGTYCRWSTRQWLTVVALLQLYVALIVTYPWQQPQNFVSYWNFNIRFFPIQIPCFNVSHIQKLIFILYTLKKCVIRSLMTGLHLKKNYNIQPSSYGADAFIHKTKFILHPLPSTSA